MSKRKIMISRHGNNALSHSSTPDSECRKKIIEILSEITLNRDFEYYSSEVKLKDDLGLDSLGIINLVIELNHSFGIEIKSIEIVSENFDTVGNLEEFILKKL